jgi:hypothetical protein
MPGGIHSFTRTGPLSEFEKIGGFAANYGAALTTGGGGAAIGAATGVNPLTAITPDPLTAASYGMITLNPVNAMGRLWSGVTGRQGPFSALGIGSSSWKYTGAWGYKTLLTGLGETTSAAGFFSKASAGNVVLSATEFLGTYLRDTVGLSENMAVQAMSNARRLGLAGMANLQQGTGGPGGHLAKNMKYKWLYHLAGIDPIAEQKAGNLVMRGLSGSIKKTTGGGVQQVAGAALKKVSGLASTATVSGLAAGAATATIGGGVASALSIASGAYSLYTLYQLTSMAGGWAFNTSFEGMGETVTSIMRYIDEQGSPNVGRGRLRTAMQSRGAATERQRAVRASYASKINPGNRMYGNEAQYHHSR